MTLQLAVDRLPTTSGEPNLREATFDDYTQIARLEWQNGLYPQPFEDWRRLWTDHPLVRVLRDRPIGWVMEDHDRHIVGSLMNMSSAYCFHGEQLLCGNGRGWVVAPEFRGYSLWLMDEYLSQPDTDLFMATTVGESALETWSHLGRRVPMGDWCGVSYWITSHRSFMRHALDKRRQPLPRLSPLIAGAIKLRDQFMAGVPRPPSGLTYASIATFDDRFDLLWHELSARNSGRLMGIRDRATLAWHFATPLRHNDLWIFTATRNRMLRGYCVFKRHPQSSGMKRMRLIDYQSVDEDQYLLPGFLHAALERCRAEQIDLLENVGVGLPKMWAFDDAAPHRRHMETWPFFYHTPDVSLAMSLQNPGAWDPSVYDGDASFE